ncbi:MAG: amidohydrolase family protein [Spirochaetaceae bacterium]|jgi:dihydroorotase|nr:amidohydrolase family protein [Spirochaetaceae bacterium]
MEGPRTLVLKNFRIVDGDRNFRGSVIVEDGVIKEIFNDETEDGLGGVLTEKELDLALHRADMVLEGGEDTAKQGLVLMPALVDLHAHFRDSLCGGFKALTKETLESASLAAAAGGYGTVVCMANTDPVIDTIEKAAALRNRAGALGFIDLYPALSLTRGMEGRELSEITKLPPVTTEPVTPGTAMTDPAIPAMTKPAMGGPGGESPVRLFSEDGRDLADDGLFCKALAQGRRTGIPLSCHCDAGGPGVEASKQRGDPRSMWSRMEENNAVRRVVDLAAREGGKLHIAHVSTGEALGIIAAARAARKEAKAARRSPRTEFSLTCEITPHHIACTEEDARRLGEESLGRVNPPLRSEEDRRALLAAIAGGAVDAIATDHAPHTGADKAAGAPGFTGLETAFGVCYTALVEPGSPEGPAVDLSRLSSLMSAGPARILGLDGSSPLPGGVLPRGRILRGYRADFCIADLKARWTVDPGAFMSRGKNTPFAGRELRGKITMTIHNGRVVYQS